MAAARALREPEPSADAETPRPARPAADHPVWAAAAGEPNAAERLVTDLLPRVRNLVRYLVWRDAEVDDITQESLLLVLSGLPSYRGEGAFESWVDRVVVRATFAHLRRLRSEPATGHAAPLEAAAAAGLATLPDEYLQRRRAIAVLDRLSLEQRHAVVLHHVLEMTVPEIAEHVGAPTETVRSRLRLARDKLREWGLETSAEDEA